MSNPSPDQIACEAASLSELFKAAYKHFIPHEKIHAAMADVALLQTLLSALRSASLADKAEIEGLKRDRERLDWIEIHECAIGWPHPENFDYWIFSDGGGPDYNGTTLREAIDKASSPTPSEQREEKI